MDTFLNDLLVEAVANKASDIHLTVGLAPVFRINGHLIKVGFESREQLSPEELEQIVKQLLDVNQLGQLQSKGEVDVSYALAKVGRFRINVYRQRGCFSLAIRIVPFKVPSLEELSLPAVIGEFAKKKQGLVLVTGATGSGKSTTLAALIDKINRERNCHIITIEDPIEYLHQHKNCILNQRELGSDTLTFSNALRAALRQDPDVILVGEMRDLETIQIALTAAETGHLVLSTLHTGSAAQTIERIVDIFPAEQQQQVKIQLASTLLGTITQQLLPRQDAQGRVVATEIMLATPGIKNLIREGKTHQILSIIQTGAKYGMQQMDASLKELVLGGLVSVETATKFAHEPDAFRRSMGGELQTFSF